MVKNSSPNKYSSLNISSPYHPISTSPLTDNTSPHPPKYNTHTNPPNNFSRRHSHLPSLSSPPHLHHSIPPEDTKIDESSIKSSVHNV